MGPSWTRRLLVVEDDRMVASLLAGALTGAGYAVVTAADVVRAMDLIETFDPDAALLDIDLGHGPSGIDLAHAIAAKHPHVAILFLTRHADAVSAGHQPEDLPPGCGFIRKTRVSDVDHLVDAIESVLRDEPRDVRHDLAAEQPLGMLSRSQVEILRLAATGLTNSAIARQRGTTERTVERAMTEVFKAMGITVSADVNPRVEAVRRFIAIAGLPALTSAAAGDS